MNLQANEKRSSSTWAIAVRMAGLYALLASLYVLGTGWLLHRFIKDPVAAVPWENAKGMMFVALTATYLAVVLARWLHRFRKIIQERNDIEAQLRLVGDNLPDSYVYQCSMIPGKPLVFEYISAGVEQVHGLKPQQVMRDAGVLFEQLTPASAAAYLLAEAKSMQDVTEFDMELEFHRPNRGIIFARARSRPRRESDGRIVWEGFVEDITLAKKLELERLAAAARYRSFFENMINGMIHGRLIHELGKPVDFEVMEVNAAFTTLTGLKEVVGKRGSAVVPELLLDVELMKMLERVSSGSGPLRFERFLKPFNNWFSVSLHSPAPDQLVAFFELVTDRRLAEELRQKREHQLERIIKAAHDGFWLVGTDGRVIEANEAAALALGYQAEELVGMHLSQIDCFDDPAKVAERMRQIVQTGGARFDTRHRRKDGKCMEVEISVAYLEQEGGQFASFIRDLTERKAAQAALREREQQLRLFVDYSPAAVAMLDADMNYLIVSRRWLHDFGLGEKKVKGLNLFDAQPELPERWNKVLKDCLAGSVQRCEEDTFFRRNGAQEWLRWEMRPWMSAEGKPGGVILLTELITERIHAELDLKESRRLLERSQDLLQEMGHLAKVGGWEWSPVTGEGHWTQEVAWIHDQELFAPPGRELSLPFCTEESRARLTAANAAAIEHGVPFDLELEIITPKGIRKSIRKICKPILEGGKVVRLCGSVQDITELRQTEAALEDEAVRRRVLFEQTSVGIVILDEACKVYECNDRFARMLGYSLEEIHSLYLWDWDVRWTREELTRRLSEMGAGGCHSETMHRRKDGGILTIDVTSNPAIVRGRRLVFCVCLDISDRKRAELVLRNSEEQFRAIFELASIGMAQADPFSGRIMRANRRMCSITGYTESELLQRTVAEITHPEDRDTDQLRSREVIAGALPDYQMEKRYLRKDGTIAWVNVNMTVIRNDSGTPLRTMATIEDITFRREAEADRLRLAGALDQAAELVVMTNLEGEILYVNRAFERVTGYARAEALGRNPRFLKSGQQDDTFYRNMWGTLGRGEVWRGHLINRRKDGSTYEEDATISPVRDSDGKVVSYLAVKLDVTRERALEVQFRQSQKMEAIGLLAGGVAHDFNNIMAAMMMQIELAQLSGELNSEVQEAFNQIQGNVTRAANLTRQLLLFSRKSSMQPRNFDLNGLLRDFSRMLGRIIGEDVDLQLELHPEPLRIHADAGMLEQVLMNLAVNARDAMPRGGRLTIRSEPRLVGESFASDHRELSPGWYVWLSVRDTGSGIPPEVLPRIFEPFFTTKDVGKGTGLGLATVFGIVEQHHSCILVESKPGQGTEFQLFIPMSSATTSKPSAKPPKADGGSERILLVEDEEKLRVLTRRLLESNGYVVWEATKGADALKIWENHRDGIALLLTDMIMPGGMNGWQLGEQLRRDRPDLKIVYISGYLRELETQGIQNNPRDPFLRKPCSPNELLDTIRKCLDTPVPEATPDPGKAIP